MGPCASSLDGNSDSRAPGSTSLAAATSSAPRLGASISSTMGSFVFSNPNKRREQATELLGRHANFSVEYKPLANTDEIACLSMLHTIKIFDGITEEDMSQLAATFEIAQCPEGHCICREGGFADCFYLLLRGAVKVTARSNFGKEVILTTEVAGFYFGEVALLGDTVRTASVITLGPSTILRLGRARFMRLVRKAPAIGKRLKQAGGTRMKNNLDTIVLFSGLQKNTRARLNKMVTIEEYKDKHIVFKEGSHADKFYVIYQGIVKVTTQDSNGKELLLAMLTDGDFFGEIGLLNCNYKRTATVMTFEPTILMTITAQDFASLTSISDQVFSWTRSKMIKRLANSLHAFPVFSELAREQRRVLGKFFQCLNVMKGEALFKQGQQANGLHIIVAGEISIKVKKEQSSSDLEKVEEMDTGAEENIEVETCGPGDPVGVMDIMNNSKVRTCSAYVASDVAILLSLSRETFLKRFLTIIPEMSTVFRTISHEREKRVKWLGKNIFEAMPEIDDEMKNWDEEEKRMEKLVVAKAKVEDYNTATTSTSKSGKKSATGIASASSESADKEKDLSLGKSGGSSRSSNGDKETNTNAEDVDGTGSNVVETGSDDSAQDSDTGQGGERLRSASTKRLIAAELRLQVKRERVFRDAFALPPESPIVKKRSPFKDVAEFSGIGVGLGDGGGGGSGVEGGNSVVEGDGTHDRV